MPLSFSHRSSLKVTAATTTSALSSLPFYLVLSVHENPVVSREDTGKRSDRGNGGRSLGAPAIQTWPSTTLLRIPPAASPRTSTRPQSMKISSTLVCFTERPVMLLTRYTLITFIPKNLFEQFRRFTNIYFLIVVIITLIPQISPITYASQHCPFLLLLLFVVHYFLSLSLSLSPSLLFNSQLFSDHMSPSSLFCLCFS